MSGNDDIKYYMAAEKMANLIYCVEMTMEFMEEFKIVPDEEVKKALNPLMERLIEWMK